MALQDVVRNLASHHTLRDLDPDALRLLAFSAETRILRAGDVLFQAGDTSDGGYIMLTGAIVMEGPGEDKLVEPPALIGDSALMAETIRPVTATAREPSTVLKISRALFHRVLEEYPESAAALRRSLAERLRVLGGELDVVRQWSDTLLDPGRHASDQV